MRWFDKHSIERVLQWFILTFTLVFGFFLIYALIFHLIGTPLGGFLYIGSFMLAVSSTYGFLYWMVKG